MKNNHFGNRQKRGVRRRHPNLGSYLIVTDTEETEKRYFEGLKASLPENVINNVSIKVVNTKTQKLISKAKEYQSKESKYSQIWIVFDKDQVVNFDAIIAEAEKCGIEVGWSNPCFEIWLAAYFGEMPNWNTSVNCCKKFGELFAEKTGKEYEKNLKTLYNELTKYGNEDNAISLAISKLAEAKKKYRNPSGQSPATTVFKLVKEIKE